MDPNFAVAHWHLGLAYEQRQVLDAATEEFKKAISLSAGSPLMKAALGRAYAKSQKKHEANEMLNELSELSKQQYVSAYEVATIYVALCNNEQAFQLLEQAYGEHSFHLVYLNVSPQFKHVSSDRRFQDLVQRIGLSRLLRRTLASFWRTRCGTILASKNSHSEHRKIFVNSSCRNCFQIPCVPDYFLPIDKRALLRRYLPPPFRAI